MKYAVVAGGAGFIGSHLCKKLLDKGLFVICIDNFISGQEENVSRFNADNNFVFINQDIVKNVDNIFSQFSNIDYIFHLASPASPNENSDRSYLSYPIETLLVNSVGTYNLLNIAKQKSARFLYASTSEVYGDPEISPQVESYFGNVNPNGIRSVYDEGKRFGEAITMAYFRKFGVDVRISRIFNTYGENMRIDDGRVVSSFIVQALKNEPLEIYGEGTQTRSFCYISDLVDGIYEFMMRDNLGGEVINLGNPIEFQIKDLAIKIKELVGSKSEIVFKDLPKDDPMQRKPDISKAAKLLDYKPKVGIDEGLKKTIAYFKEQI